MKVNTGSYGSSTPKLEPDDLESDAALLTITGFESVEVDDDAAPGGKRMAATLTFEETADKVLWLNKGMVEALVQELGEESDAWVGQVIPVEKYVARFRGQKYPKVRVMPSEEWAAAFKDAGAKRKTPAAKAAPAKAKGGKR